MDVKQQLQTTIRGLLTESASRPDHVSIMGSGSTLSTSSNMTIFQSLVQKIENINARSVTDMRQLKLRDSKKEKGQLWEWFCKSWLESTGRYKDVWLLSDLPQEHRDALQLSKQDSGIDIIVKISNNQSVNIEKCGFDPNSQYVAVQCKYRGPNKLGNTKRLAWAMVDSFVGLCALTGPWQYGLVMTNAPGFGRRSVPLKNRVRTLCDRTFMATKRPHWEQMAGLGHGYVLETEVDDIKVKAPKPKAKAKAKPQKLNPETKPITSVELMREARLKALGQN